MSNLILISGEEEFLVERAILSEVNAYLSPHVFEYSMPDAASLYDQESQISPSDGAKRVFVVRNAKGVPILPVGEFALIVVSLKPLLDSRSDRSLSFPKLKAYDNKNEVIGWIMKEGESHNIDLSRVARALFVNTGNCLRKLASEIEKIATVVSSGTVVSPDDIRRLTCFSADLTPKDIIGAICDGQTTKALAYYDKLQERGDETGWIIAYAQRHVIQQLRFEDAKSDGMPDEDIARLLDVHPFVLKKNIEPRLGLWTRKSLVQSLDTLCDLDLAHKRGDTFACFGLQLEIIRLCEEANNVRRR